MALPPSLARTSSVLGISFLVLAACGCGGSKLHSVGGKATVDNQPLNGGVVTFVPDTEKGNKSKSSAVGKIGSDGSYSLTTDGKPGVAAGWYKVTVMPGMPEMGTNLTPDGKAPQMLTSAVNPKYNSPTTTDLSIEVKDSGGPYDLKMSQ